MAELPLLLLISLDGFRHSFVSESQTPELWRLASEGVRFARGLRSQFPTDTMANHNAILSGRFVADSGIVANVFKDPVFGDTYDYWNFTGNQSRWEDSKRGRWYSGTPIWLANEEASPDRRSGSMKFPAGDVTYRGHRASKAVPWADFVGAEGWASDADELVRWFTDPEAPLNFGLFYIGQPDELEHQTGVHSSNVSQVVHQIDGFIGQLRAKFTAAGLWDSLNLIVTGDHGHVDAVYPEDIVPLGDYRWLWEEENFEHNSEVTWVAPKGMGEEKMRQVYERLRHEMVERDRQPVEVLFRPDIMKRFQVLGDCAPYDYLKGFLPSDRCGDILVFGRANETRAWRVQRNTTAELTPKNFNGTHGQHGFTSPHLLSNRALLILRGPAFERGLVSESDAPQNIDLYPLMCRVLAIPDAACPRGNGSLDRLQEALRASWSSDAAIRWAAGHSRPIVLVFAVALPIACLALYCLAQACAPRSRKGKSSTNGYAQLGTANGDLLTLDNVAALSEDEL